jgi:UDP-4-amino-4,6-dideoxy-N-acetyl-beta-L-altrosamine N-acetyltransferase
MLTDRPITPEEHRTFVEKLPKDPTRFYGLVFKEEEPLGVVDLTAIDPERGSAYIGLYARPGVRGAGTLLMGALLYEAFTRRRLKKVRAEVFTDNERAIALYRRFGFREKGAKAHEKGELSIMELAL